MERLLSTLYWLSDLYGVISASLLIDRLGAAIAKTTERPAKRLLILGLVMALLTGLASIVPGLRTLATTVETFLGLPIIILGILCFMSLILGRWFQRVAGQAGDFYERAAEAQFLGLIKLVKRTSMKEHEELLERRILIPEAKLTGRSRPTTRAATRMHFAERMAAVMDERGKVEPGEVAERVALLYRHYLDGAPLHRSGSTTTNQLLGNLVIDNIRRERLKLKRKELKSLLKLDLERSRSILGPYLWFNFITLAVAQRTARLIVEYNIHSVPLEERELYCAEELTAVDSWLDRRRESADRTERPKKIDLIYRTTAFTAIDFLTRDPERDRMIQQKFGEELSAQLMQDRRQLIREVFGTFPFSRWPKARRSINLYDLYWCHLGGARAVLFPLAMAWKALRLQAFLLGRLLRTLRDLLSPQRGLAIRETAVASYDVAQRKINRMRKPMFMEATRLRARFDVEYMGLFLPGKRTSGLELQGYEQDLRFIGALKEEEDGYIEIRRAHRRSLQTLAALMRIEGWEDDGMATWMAEQNPALASREREALRACAVAYAIDYQSVCSLTELELSIRRGLNQAVASQGKLAVGRLRSARGSLMRGLFCWTPRSVMRRRAFDRYWTANCSGRPDEERDYCRRYALADTQGLGRRILQARKHDDVPLAKVREIVQRICRNPTTWTDQLLTLRTVQSLALLDVFSDRQIVRDLGEYEDSTEPPRPVVLPRL